ncbi:type VI secretion system-associated protein TagO [Zavarzinia sp.]|uniref:type VI secretion system-associated protein TagO n=1 Tax=Zavarzinia sp. TaxID=2027920 RepID=UPI003BB7F471
MRNLLLAGIAALEVVAAATCSLAGEGAGHWRVVTEVSPIDDSRNVYLSVASDAEIADRFGRPVRPALHLACRENVTSLWLNFGGLFMADIQGFGDVTVRVDAERARRISMRASTDHEALGLWTGGQAVPFIQGLFGRENLFVRAVPFSSGAVDLTFAIGGLAEAVKPLATACHWGAHGSPRPRPKSELEKQVDELLVRPSGQKP